MQNTRCSVLVYTSYPQLIHRFIKFRLNCYSAIADLLTEWTIIPVDCFFRDQLSGTISPTPEKRSLLRVYTYVYKPLD